MVANGMEGVPWMISGADHSADIARVLAYAATSGVSGVINPNDLKVVPSGTANMQVHMGVGALAAVNRSGVQSESYIGRAVAVSDLDIATTGSSGRSDLVVVRIKDPQFPPWQTLYAEGSEGAISGPFAFPEIIPGVPANTVRAEQLNLPQSFYAAARLDLPPNTTAGITSDMIKDLRSLVAPHYLPVNALQQGPTPAADVNVGDTAWKNWPSNAIDVPVPIWATHADIEIVLNGVLSNASANMNTRIAFGSLQGPSVPYDVNLTFTGGDAVVHQHSTQASFDVTPFAGTTQTLRLNAQRTFATESTGNIEINSSQQVKFRVEFFQRPL
jgi:hypothetical protein